MKDLLISELALCAGRIDTLIAEDSFPCAVVPEYLQKSMRYYPAAGGKRLRPAIMLWSAAAAGGDMEKILPAAAALEVFHNWTLVHDDIIDDDDVRRNKPTAHIVLSQALPVEKSQQKKFGCDMAVLAGDLMQAWAFDLIDKSLCSAEVKLKLSGELRQYGYIKLVSGEAVDVEMSYCNVEDISEAELFAMQSGKTGALLHYAARAGWMAGCGEVAAWDSPEAAALGRFGDALAIAFQLRDDYLGIFGKLEKFGKPIGSDLQESKATLLLIHALKNLDAGSKKELQSLLGLPVYSASDIEKARGLFLQAGSVDYLQQTIEQKSNEAREALSVLPENRWKKLLETLTDYLVNRDK